MNFNSIWVDNDITLTSYLINGSVTYTIEVGNTTIFTGRAFAKPDGSCIIRINDICADYLKQTMFAYASDGVTLNPNINSSFIVKVGSTTVATVPFVLDWSYDVAQHAEQTSLSAPIRHKMPVGFPIVYTLMGAGSVSRTQINAAGTSSSDTITFSGSGTYVSTYSSAVKRVVIGQQTFDIIPNCEARYALYYVNAYGGWDEIALKGTELRTDSYNRYTNESSYKEGTGAQERGKRNYLNEITTKWTLRTGILTDDEASRMHHLLGSVNIWLFDSNTQKMYPVTITDTDCPYYRVRNNSGNPVEYTINVELAQSRIRR